LKLFVSLFFIIFAFSISFAQDFTINRYRSDITVYNDFSIRIKETIEIFFHKPRYIYRDIRFKCIDENNKIRTTPIKIISLKDEWGFDQKFKTTKS